MQEQTIGEPKYPNPLFKKHQSQGFLTRWGRLFGISAGLLIILLYIASVLFTRNPQSFITLAIFTGNTRHTDKELVSVVNEALHGNYALLYPKKNIYVAKTSSIIKTLQTRFFYDTVAVEKVYSKRTLYISVTEKPLEYVLTYNNVSRYVAQDGLILELVSDKVNNNDILEIIITQEHVQTNANIDVIDPALIAKTTELEAVYRDIFSDTLLRLEYPTATGTDAKLYTRNGWYIHVDISNNIQDQVQNAYHVFTQKIKGTENEKHLDYIDVRVETRAYYF